MTTEWVLLDNNTWVNDEYGLHAYVKWDGCTHLWFDDRTEEHTYGCYHHICDLDGFIEVMQLLRQQAAQAFEEDWLRHPEWIAPFHRQAREKEDKR